MLTDAQRERFIANIHQQLKEPNISAVEVELLTEMLKGFLKNQSQSVRWKARGALSVPRVRASASRATG